MLGAILGIGSAIAGIAGGASADSAADRAAAAQNKQNLQNWKYDWKQAQRNYDYNRRGLQISKKNDKALRKYEYKTAKLDWEYGMAIRDYEYRNAMRQYNKSEEIYKQQLGFNNMAAAVAFESEQRRHTDILIGQAFQQQDLMVQTLQEQGEVQANVASGRSGRKVQQSTIAEYGRNLAILAESLTSAKKQNMANVRGIWRDKYGADLAAEAARMIRPEMAPALPPPMRAPKPKYQKPMKPERPPKPVKMAGSGSVNTINAVSSGLSGLAGINWGG